MSTTPDQQDLITIGQSIIDQVDSVFVFGSGNRYDSAKKTGGWSSTIQGTSRAAHTYLADHTSKKKFTLKRISDLYEGSDPVIFHANMTGLAMAARIGNCHENAALALYFCLLRKDTNGNPIFSNASIVAYKGLHVLVKAETSNGNVIYIDPWESQCYSARDFVLHHPPGGLSEAGNTERHLNNLLQVFANANDVPSKTGVPNCIDKEWYLERCELAIEKHLRAMNVHPEDMEFYLSHYNDLKRSYDKHSKSLDMYKHFVSDESIKAKEKTLRGIRKNPTLPKKPPT